MDEKQQKINEILQDLKPLIFGLKDEKIGRVLAKEKGSKTQLKKVISLWSMLDDLDSVNNPEEPWKPIFTRLE